MAGAGEEEGELTLETTPTWIVAVVCSVIVFISLAVERLLHYLGKALKRRNQKPLFEALQKVKEELMLLGFISLLLVVFQGSLQRICIPKGFYRHMLPCTKQDVGTGTGHRRLLSGGGEEVEEVLANCARKGKVPLLSLETIHQLHIFIFILAVTHVILSLITVLLGGAKIQQWKHWEDSIQKEDKTNGAEKLTHVSQEEFIQEHFVGFEKSSKILSWMRCFVKQFYGSVTKSDYTTMRLGFIMTHCKSNPKFNFYKYMVRALEADFKKVVGISWYLWIFVVVFLLLDVHGWHTYFWMSFIPLITTYGFNSCIMGQARFIVPRLVISVIIQLLCSYSTLPLYAIVTQMGSSFKRAIFEEHVGEKIVGWADEVKNRVRRRASNLENPSLRPAAGTRLQSLLVRKESSTGEVKHEPVELNEIEASN